MNKKEITKTLQELKKNSKKRGFSQTIDLIINLRNIDVKKPSGQISFFGTIPNLKSKPVKICALVGPETKDQAKEACDEVILADEFEKYKDKKSAKQLADSYNYFIAQANMMGQIATIFGKTFGPKGKMPNPKAGCVVPPKANVKSTVERLKKTVKVDNKKSMTIQIPIGSEDMNEEKVAENIISIFDQIVHHLPQERHNVKLALIKLTMSKPVKLEI